MYSRTGLPTLHDTRHQRPTQVHAQHLQPRNPFDSPNLSTSSLNDTDGSTSGQDEFDLERYSSNTKFYHLRQASKSSTSGEKDKKPDLNIVTDFSGPKMPMDSGAVLVSDIPAKQRAADRKKKAISIVSHKAIRATASPPDQNNSTVGYQTSTSTKSRTFKGSRNGKPIQRLQNAIAQPQQSPFTQRIPIGITIPQGEAARLDKAITDSALPSVTPLTPAIIITPAGEQRPWLLQRRGTDEQRRPASSIYSAMPTEKVPWNPSEAPPLPRGLNNEKTGYAPRRASVESATPILDSADTARPKSQGWWNLMLSPLLRAGSLASRNGRQPTETPPVPPLPFSATEKEDSPATSARSDPSFLVSACDTSPDTPRRQGLASTRASTWSRWTEWDKEREANSRDLAEDDPLVVQRDIDTLKKDQILAPTVAGPGLAAEYFHACAVELLTGEPYFDCVNHSCAEQLPKLQSIDSEHTKRTLVLASPFKSPVADRGIGPENVRSPSIPDADEHLSPNELSPNVRQANIASIVKATALDNSTDKGSETKVAMGTHSSQQQDKGSSPPRTGTIPVSRNTSPPPHNNDDPPNIAAVAPPPQVVEVKVTHAYPAAPATTTQVSEKAPVVDSVSVASPGPMSPEGQKSVAPVGAVAMADMEQKHAAYPAPVHFNNYTYHEPMPTRPAFITADTEYPPMPDRRPTAPVTAADLDGTKRRLSIEERRQRHEKEDGMAKKIGGLWRGQGCFRGCMGRGGPEKRTKRRWIVGIALTILALIITCIVLAVTLTRHGDGTPVDSQWLNLTGYPPMPTGILTIATPNLVTEQKQCVNPTTLWSCSVPKEDRGEIGTNDSDQPNFRFEIKFRNGTVPDNMTVPLDTKSQRLSKRVNDPFTNDLFVPNPAPPPQPEQVFMGNTTDNITAPFDGEKTPFYITFMPSFPILPDAFNDSSPSSSSNKRSLNPRQSNSSSGNDSTNNDRYRQILDALPAPALSNDGSAAPASLLPTTPFPISQPIKLYNRDSLDEHYGFYMYYDKSIYLSGLTISANSSSSSTGDIVEADQDGGSTKQAANALCTFAQTRFKVAFYTNPAFGGTLLPNDTSVATPDDKGNGKTKTSSATNFTRPGSFPYPASITLDRHGGDINEKVAYCYGMSNGQIITDEKVVVGERRDVGGVLVNAAPGILGNVDSVDKSLGGIDGGTGGCGCGWQNWQ